MQSGSIYSGPKVRRSVCVRTGRVMYTIDSIARDALISLIEADTGRCISDFGEWEATQRVIHRTLSYYFWRVCDNDLSDWLRQNSALVTFGIVWRYARPEVVLPNERRVSQLNSSTFQWGICFEHNDPLESFFALTFL